MTRPTVPPDVLCSLHVHLESPDPDDLVGRGHRLIYAGVDGRIERWIGKKELSGRPVLRIVRTGVVRRTA